MKKGNQHPLMGGLFGLPHSVAPRSTEKSSNWLFLRESNLFLVNARSGIQILIDRIRPSSVWMPSYLCPTMLEPIDQKKTNVRFYEVNSDLCIPSIDWINDVKRGDLVVLIDYFGFPLDAKVASLIKERGAWVLEDACQALLSNHIRRFSDFVLFSPRKTLGVADGGILVSLCEVEFSEVELEPVPSAWWLKMLEAAIKRREYDQWGGDRRWFRLFREAEEETPIGYYAMSDLSRNLLIHNFEYKEIAKKRIDNYSRLSQKLTAIFPSLPDGTVPLGFPIKHPQRDVLRDFLFQIQIFPPIHWQIDEDVPMRFSDSHRLSRQIMTLPCDQRYAKEDINRLATHVIKALKKIQHTQT